MSSIPKWLRKALGSEESKPDRAARPPAAKPPQKTASSSGPAAAAPAAKGEQPGADPHAQARAYLRKVRVKLNQLAGDFNSGTINRSQFQSLYSHY